MTYQEKFCVSLRVNGKVLRERNSVVALPFNSEYEVRLKNLNSVKAQVNVSIDGKDATDGWLVMEPNSTLDLERWIKDGNLTSGNKFKFIQRTAQIEKHRGIEVDDGIVRVEYKFQKPNPFVAPSPVVIHEHHYHNNPYWWNGYYWPYYPYYPYPITANVMTGVANSEYINVGQISNPTYTCGTSQFTQSSVDNNAQGGVGNTIFAMNCSMNSAPLNQMVESQNTEGITVPGSESHQAFGTTYDFECEESKVLILRLVGEVNKIPVNKPLTVDVKPKCQICGRTNSPTNKFCSECGTSLIIY
jgi:hypothetical protein